MEAPRVTLLNEYQTAAALTANYPADSLYPFLGLCGEAGEVAELAKKCLRDDGGVWSEERRNALKKELGDAMWYIADIARAHGFTLTDIAQTNLDKLYSRKARGVIHGSGNDR